MDYPIAGNDDAIRSVRMILATIGQIVTQAQAEYEAKYARRKTAEEAAAAPPEAPRRSAPVAAAEPAAAPAAPRRPAGLALFGTRLDRSGRAAFRCSLNYQLLTIDYLYG